LTRTRFTKSGALHLLLLCLILLLGTSLRFTRTGDIGPRLWDEGIYLQEARFLYTLLDALSDSFALKVRESRTKEDLWKKEDQINHIRERIRGSAPIFGRLNHDLAILLGMFVLGPDDPSVGTRVSAFTGSLTLLVLYFLATRLYGPRTALFTTLIFSLLGYHIHYCRSTMAEPTMLLFLLCAFYFYAGSRTARRHGSTTSLALSALFLGMAFTTHNRMLVMLGIFLLYELCLWVRGEPHQPPFRMKRFLVFLSFFSLPLAAWESLYYTALLLGKHLGIVLTAPTYLEQLITATGRSALWAYISKVYRPDGFLTFPYLLWKSSGIVLLPIFLAGLVLALRRRTFQDLLVCTWIFLPYVFYSFTTAGLSRTYTVLLPPLALLSGATLFTGSKDSPPGAHTPRMAGTLLPVILVILVLGNGLVYGHRATGSRDGYEEAMSCIRSLERGDVISTNVPVLQAYAGEQRVVGKPPRSMEDLEGLVQKGFAFYLMDYNRYFYALYQKDRVEVMDALAGRLEPVCEASNPFVREPLTAFEANLFFWDTLNLQSEISEMGLDKIRIYTLENRFSRLQTLPSQEGMK